MKNLLKLGLVVFGFALATVAATRNASAEVKTLVAGEAGCVGAGDCGTTKNGTHLNGSWREW